MAIAARVATLVLLLTCACAQEHAAEPTEPVCCSELAPDAPTDAAPDVQSVSDASLPDTGPSDPGSRSRRALVDPTRWVLVDPLDDPFDDRPAIVECPTGSYLAIDLAGEAAFEVETGKCNYLTVGQPSLVEVRAGDRIHLRIWHFDLTAPEAAEAHAAIAMNGGTVWEATVAIPAAGQLISTDWYAAETLSAGTVIHFHLHNHGANSWNLVELSGGP